MSDATSKAGTRPASPGRAVPVLIAFAGLTLAAPGARAQSQWLDRIPRAGTHLEIAKPLIEREDETFLTTAWFLTGRVTLAANLALVGELPLAHFDAAPQTFMFPGGTYTYSPETQTAIGNPYIGIETGAAARPAVVLEVGIRVPIASEDVSNALATGLLADVDRWEAWFPSAFAARIGLHVHSSPDPLLWVDGRLAPVLIVATEGGYADVFTTYGLQLRTTQESVRAGAGIGGRVLLSTADAPAYHQIEVVADFLRGPWRPGLALRFPLESDLTEDVSAVPVVTLAFVGR